MNHDHSPEYSTAVQDFRDARRRAALQDLLGKFLKKPADLLPFEETNRLLKGQSAQYIGLKEIPLEAIIGSVGRYKDFTRSFMPRRISDENRWARVKAHIPRGGFNPIEVYQIGEAYFVLDGNHRVSIARARGDETIQAYITQIDTKVKLLREDQPDDLIRKAELTDFLEQTKLDISRSETSFKTTLPGAFNALVQRIDSHRRKNENISWENLSIRWHDEDYVPFILLLRKKGLQRDFPNRTETDLYAWILKRQEEIIKEIGWEVPLEFAADNIFTEFSRRARRVSKRLLEQITDLATPDPFESGPKPGKWRQWALETHREDHLFTDYLVPISGSEESWVALEQALVYAGMEQDYVHGLHIVKNKQEALSKRSRDIQAQFEHRLSESGVNGELKIEVGNIARTICDYAAWVDTIVMNIIQPPGENPLNKLSSSLHTIIHRSPRPIIFVPSLSRQFENILLAYDGSPKAREALYVSAYLANKWRLDLTVLSVATNRVNVNTIQDAKDYLSKQHVSASYKLMEGDPADAILSTADTSKSNIILMGGYGFRPVIEMVVGSAVDRVLKESNVPVFLCR